MYIKISKIFDDNGKPVIAEVIGLMREHEQMCDYYDKKKKDMKTAILDFRKDEKMKALENGVDNNKLKRLIDLFSYHFH